MWRPSLRRVTSAPAAQQALSAPRAEDKLALQPVELQVGKRLSSQRGFKESAATLQLLRRKVGRKAVDQPDALRVWRGYLSTDGGDLRIDKCERAWCLLSHDSHGYVENHYE